LSFLVLALILSFGNAQKLNRYNIDLNSITVSGVSSGGAMAIQYHVSYSKSIAGAGVIAAPPYWCAKDKLSVALISCTTSPSLISLTELYAATQYAYGVGSIDSPSYLANSKVWLFAGTGDTIVVPGVVQKTVQYYQHYISSKNVYFVNNIGAAHSWVTDNYGNPCTYLGTPYINNCHYDGPGQMLKFLYGNLSPRVNTTQAVQTFSQSNYTPLSVSPSTLSLSNTGYIYVPKACQDGQTICKLHIAFHGCDQGNDQIGTTFAQNNGLNQWAETNKIIVVYPQAVVSRVVPYNPQGCWDWWGYLGPEYATKLAPQIKFVSNIISALTGRENIY